MEEKIIENREEIEKAHIEKEKAKENKFTIHIGSSGITVKFRDYSKPKNNNIIISLGEAIEQYHYTFNLKKWFAIKDLHPLAEDLQKVRDYINSLDRKDVFNGTTFELQLTPKMYEILKTAGDWKLFNILMNQYLSSNEAFEYILPEIVKDIYG